MLYYHTELTVTHPFSSPWWSWPLLIKPVWLYFSKLGEKWVSTVTLMGNPAVWWIGIASIIEVCARAVKWKKPSDLYLATMFFIQWIPYAFISRTLFLSM
jgi:dolichyl-phosphate-mannose--protein O-mannosyl transferase